MQTDYVGLLSFGSLRSAKKSQARSVVIPGSLCGGKREGLRAAALALNLLLRNLIAGFAAA